MWLNKLHIDNFKNFESLDISFLPKLNCIIGKNGVGKTNLLDAIYYLSICKSNFGILDSFCVTRETNYFLLQGDFEKQLVDYQIMCSYHSDLKKKQVKCNGKKYDRVANHIGLLPVVFITPSDITLINGGGAERRKFLDVFISQMCKQYLESLLKYNKLIAQRNKILKLDDDTSNKDLLSVIDNQLITAANYIYKKRKEVVETLIPDIKKYYKKISGKEDVLVKYESALNNSSIETILKKNEKRDRIMQYTTSGIHRDDIVFYIDNFDLRQIGSQGQKKSFLLALKFAQYEYLFTKTEEKPILLLDDLFDKLDYERCYNIIEIVSSDTFGQIFISDTDKTYIGEMIKENDSKSYLFTINEQGDIK